MAKYQVLDTAYIGGRIVEPGERIEVEDGFVPGPHLKPMDGDAHKAVRAAASRMTAMDPIEVLTEQKPGG